MLSREVCQKSVVLKNSCELLILYFLKQITSYKEINRAFAIDALCYRIIACYNQNVADLYEWTQSTRLLFVVNIARIKSPIIFGNLLYVKKSNKIIITSTERAHA